MKLIYKLNLVVAQAGMLEPFCCKIGLIIKLINDFFRDISGWLQSGQLKYKEDVAVGLENAPAAFIGLLRGDNFGKLIVKVNDDPTTA